MADVKELVKQLQAATVDAVPTVIQPRKCIINHVYDDGYVDINVNFAGEQTVLKRRFCVGDAKVNSTGMLIPINNSWKDASVIVGYNDESIKYGTLFVQREGYLCQVLTDDNTFTVDDYTFVIPRIYINDKDELIIDDTNPKHSYYRDEDYNIILKVDDD